ncbi:MAG: sulfotransferase [Alphaproteobacteria bacterium]|nr:MAG: sulfotransferase [Alphaproteobacteria bacterium]
MGRAVTQHFTTPTQRWPVRLGNRIAPGLQGLGLLPTSDNVDHLLEVATGATGLDDFGDLNFQSALALLLEDMDQDNRLHPVGRYLHRQNLLRFLKARLRLQAAFKRTPAMSKEIIARPLIILGLPRTGTTRLFNILAKDPRHRTLSLWESYRPTPAPKGPGHPGDLRRAFARLERNAAYFLAPDLPSVHHLGIDGPEECIHLLSTSFLSYLFLVEFDAPAYHEYFFASDQRPPYHFYRDILKYLQTGYRRERWLLKSPTHIFGIEGLLDAFPDALFVHTHRDPLKVAASTASLTMIARGMGASSLDPKRIGDQAFHHLDLGLNRFLKHRSQIDPSRIIDVHYEETVRDPMKVVETIYQKFALDLCDDTKAAMTQEIESKPQHFKGRHHYDAADFGLSRARVDRAFADYQERFEIAQES